MRAHDHEVLDGAAASSHIVHRREGGGGQSPTALTSLRPEMISPASVLRLQRAAGNAAVGQLLGARQPRVPVQRNDGGAPPDGGVAVPVGRKWDSGKHVSPNFVVDRPAPKRSNSDPSTTTAEDPTFAGGAAVDASTKAWRYQVDSVDSKGTIQLVYFSADHYPAPTPEDDTGSLTNVEKANWKEIVKDFKANRTGIPKFWSAYRAEVLHENYHWEVEWQGKVKPEVVNAENDIAKLKEDLGSSATAADAESKLKPQATKILDAAMKKARAAYSALGDAAGDPPYVAQAPAIDALQKRVEDHAKAQKWK